MVKFVSLRDKFGVGHIVNVTKVLEISYREKSDFITFSYEDTADFTFWFDTSNIAKYYYENILNRLME